MFGERMKTPAIPERVYALCCAVKNKGILDKEIQEKLEPSHFSEKTKYYGAVKEAALELGLILIKENVVTLAVDKKHIETIEAMRCFVGCRVFGLKDSLFYKVTESYLKLNEKVFEYGNVSKMCSIMESMIGVKIFEDDMRAWRFWTSFLGLGYMHDMILLPNMYINLKDIMSSCEFEYDKEYTIQEFVQIVRPYCEEALVDVDETKTFNLAFSNALRELHDTKIIELKHNLDASVSWNLYLMEMHTIKSTVTHISVRR